MTRKEQLAQNLQAVRHAIDEAAVAAGREPSEVQLLPVTKYHPVSDLALLHDLGVRAVAENREQEARDKAAQLPELDFHMIGQIQTKKANSVARWAACVHSVDSVKLVHALDRGMELALERGDRTSEVLPCLIQLSLDGDIQRGGVEAAGVPELAEEIEKAEHLRLAGLMCVPPLGKEARAMFALAARVREQLSAAYRRPMEFSAGMSRDLGDAIACGSTMVRVGTAILGSRQLP